MLHFYFLYFVTDLLRTNCLNNYIVQTYYSPLSSSASEGLKSIIMKSNSKNSRQPNASIAKNAQPLLRLPEARVQIYSDCIKADGIYLMQASTADTGQFASINDLPKLEQMTKQKGKEHQSNRDKVQADEYKIFMFNNPDFAFSILEQINIVQIHDLAHNSVPLKFKVNSIQNLMTVQSLLRRKMCELGFQSKYRIIKQLGKGATAEVYLVSRLSDKKQFAAKIISIKEANDKAYQTFVNESKLLRMLKHKNIIHLQSLYIHKKQLIQVMEYLSGGTLLQLIKDDKVHTRKQKWSVLRDITTALEYLRERRIVHRDLKLQNILIRLNGDQQQFVLSDFGLASWTGEKNPLFERCGTPGYIAPQVLNAPKGKPILDHKSDIFSLGVIAHILFLHQPLFSYSGNVKQLLKLNKKAQYSLDSSIYRNLSLSESTFLQMALAKNMDERGTATAILQELKYPMSSFSQITPQKSGRDKLHSKISVDSQKLGIQVQVKKPTSLTKTKINLSSDKKLEKTLQSSQKPDQKRSVSSSARKLFADVWSSITTPTPKKQRFKIKQNSIQKQKKLNQYFQ